MNISTTPRDEQLKALIWKVTENKRAVFQSYGERQFKRALNAQFKSIMTGVNALGYSILPILDQYTPTKPMEDAFILVYGRVGAFFASETYGQITKSYHPKYDLKRRRRRRFVNEQEAEVLESTWMQFMRRFAIEEAGDRIVSITNTTKEIVRRTLDKAITEGLGIDKAAKLLVKEWKEVSTRRAKVIARTEILSSSNGGSFAGAQSTGLDLMKGWLSTPGARTRDTHRALDGKFVEMDETFSNGLQYPGDPKGSASEVISCRCTIIYEPK